MSKPNPNYKGSFWEHLAKWLRGEYDPVKGRLETKAVAKKTAGKEEMQSFDQSIQKIGKYDMRMFEEGIDRQVGRYRVVYRILSVVTVVFLISLLLWTVSYMPNFGDPNAPTNNEVSQRYIEKGMEEMGTVNIVTGMILGYRAFDTFGETCVLFVASCCVLFLLRVDREDDPQSAAVEEMNDRHFEPRNDTILQKVANFLVPLILIFGIYVVLNGHLSPGGGFSGGAIMASGAILYLTAYGFKKTHRFLNEKVVDAMKAGALILYSFAITYFLYTGANQLHSIFGPGTPGNILSAGLIVFLNIFVGVEVACTMYTFYTLFRRGGI